jgi:hypothetical protein
LPQAFSSSSNHLPHVSITSHRITSKPTQNHHQSPQQNSPPHLNPQPSKPAPFPPLQNPNPNPHSPPKMCWQRLTHCLLCGHQRKGTMHYCSRGRERSESATARRPARYDPKTCSRWRYEHEDENGFCARPRCIGAAQRHHNAGEEEYENGYRAGNEPSRAVGS